MKQDIKMCKEIGADGIVFGILKEDGTVDMKRCAELLKLASPMKATFHRAFDTCPDFSAALENIISLGFERILTSGGEPTAFVGAKTIKRLIQQAAGRISIMPGGGITEQNVKQTALITGATEFHASARKPVDSKMQFRNAERVPEESRNEFGIERTDLKTVKNLVRLLQATT
jgi:copper homeostasis protein